jgi:group I intron endonuclease
MLIYKITNDINDRIYIGQTTLSLKERIYNYRKEYKHDKRHRPILDAMRKYGIEHFNFKIVGDNISSMEELDEKEKFYIKKYKSLCSENGYNIELGGNGRGKHSEETKRKISEAQKGKLNHMWSKTGKQNSTSHPIIELTTDKTYESANLASKDLNLNPSHVCSVARGERGSTGGYVFRYMNQTGKIIQPQSITRIRQKQIRDKVLPKYKKYI